MSDFLSQLLLNAELVFDFYYGMACTVGSQIKIELLN